MAELTAPIGKDAEALAMDRRATPGQDDDTDRPHNNNDTRLESDAAFVAVVVLGVAPEPASSDRDAGGSSLRVESFRGSQLTHLPGCADPAAASTSPTVREAASLHEQYTQDTGEGRASDHNVRLRPAPDMDAHHVRLRPSGHAGGNAVAQQAAWRALRAHAAGPPELFVEAHGAAGWVIVAGIGGEDVTPAPSELRAAVARAADAVSALPEVVAAGGVRVGYGYGAVAGELLGKESSRYAVVGPAVDAAAADAAGSGSQSPVDRSH